MRPTGTGNGEESLSFSTPNDADSFLLKIPGPRNSII